MKNTPLLNTPTPNLRLLTALQSWELLQEGCSTAFAAGLIARLFLGQRAPKMDSAEGAKIRGTDQEEGQQNANQ